jgi:hypothetical protein
MFTRRNDSGATQPNQPGSIRDAGHPSTHWEPELADRRFRASEHDEAEFERREPPYQQGRMEDHRARGRLHPNSGIDNLSDVDIRALEKLLTDDHHRINTAYRAGDFRIEQDPTVRVAVSAMNKMPDVQGVVHRGIHIDAQDLEAFVRRYAPGSTVREPAFQHSAKLKDGASPFNVQLEIDARHGKDMSFLRGKFEEVMHPPHTTFHSTGMRYDDKTNTLFVSLRDHSGPVDPPPGGWEPLPAVPTADPGREAWRERPDGRAPSAAPEPPPPAAADRPAVDPFANPEVQYRPTEPGNNRWQQPPAPGAPQQYGGQPHGEAYGAVPEEPSGPGQRNAKYEVREPVDSEFVSRDEPKVEAAYRWIRDLTHDVPQIAEQLKVDPGVVDVAKQNLFVNQHQVSVGPGEIVKGNFTADEYMADLWKAGMNGTLEGGERNELRSLIAHEYVEAKLMAAGVPYNFADGWTNGIYDETRENAGAHTVAPRSLQATDNLEFLLGHWNSLGLTPPPGGLARDLSNLDDIVRRAIEGMGW